MLSEKLAGGTNGTVVQAPAGGREERIGSSLLYYIVCIWEGALSDDFGLTKAVEMDIA